jgi:hypothetical protein
LTSRSRLSITTGRASRAGHAGAWIPAGADRKRRSRSTAARCRPSAIASAAGTSPGSARPAACRGALLFRGHFDLDHTIGPDQPVRARATHRDCGMRDESNLGHFGVAIETVCFARMGSLSRAPAHGVIGEARRAGVGQALGNQFGHVVGAAGAPPGFRPRHDVGDTRGGDAPEAHLRHASEPCKISLTCRSPRFSCSPPAARAGNPSRPDRTGMPLRSTPAWQG